MVLWNVKPHIKPHLKHFQRNEIWRNIFSATASQRIFDKFSDREKDCCLQANSLFVRGICITQRKIVNNIFKSNQIMCLCSGKMENIVKINSANLLKTAYLLGKLSSKRGNNFSLLLVNLIEYYGVFFSTMKMSPSYKVH